MNSLYVKEVKDPLIDKLGYQLRRASLVVMNDLYDCLSPLDISVAKASVLMVIERNEGIKLVEVGDCLDIKRANITPIITELEKRGLVLRAIDGRAHALKLSEQGAEVVSQVRQLMEESEERCFGHLDRSSRDTLHSILLSVRSGLG